MNTMMWCTTGPVAGHALGQLDPFVFRKARIDRVVPIRLDPLGLHVHRLLGHVKNLVRLARHEPAGVKFSRLGQIARVAPRAAGGHPIGDQLFLLG